MAVERTTPDAGDGPKRDDEGPAPTQPPSASELSRPSRKRIDELLTVLRRIHEEEDPSPELPRHFRDRYLELPKDVRPAFFETLLRRMEISRQAIVTELQALAAVEEDATIDWCRRMTALRQRLESPRMGAFRRFPNTPGGFKFLLDLRSDILAAQRLSAADLEPLDEEIAHLFNSWFQQGFLFLQEINLDSPFRQVQFLKEHDLVHPMATLEEMGARLGGDRRCFALYHRALSEEPVVFIEAALTRGTARSIHDIIGDENGYARSRREPDTAIFYSISNTQNGLAGLGLGRVLVFRVVEEIKRGCPGIKTFATLSPIPGLWKRYLRPILLGEDAPFLLKKDRLPQFFTEKAREALVQRLAKTTGDAPPDLAAALKRALETQDWIGDASLCKLLRRPLIRITHFYLTKEKNRQGNPLNPVANFHLSNGARLGSSNVNFGANRSQRGLEESCGMMVNYVYSPTWLQTIGRTVRSLLPWKK